MGNHPWAYNISYICNMKGLAMVLIRHVVTKVNLKMQVSDLSIKCLCNTTDDQALLTWFTCCILARLCVPACVNGVMHTHWQLIIVGQCYRYNKCLLLQHKMCDTPQCLHWVTFIMRK